MEIGYRQRRPRGNPGLDRFMASGQEDREGGQQNLRTIGEMYKFYNQKEGGLFGRYGTEETKPQFASLSAAQTFDESTGKFFSKAGKAAGDFAMENLGGNYLKEAGANFMKSTAGQVLGSGANLLWKAAPYAAIAKEVYDFMGNTKDAYEGYEQGIKNAGVMQQDLALQRDAAKNRMLSQNVEVKEMVADRRGNLQDQVSGQAEQVISAGEAAKIKSNLEMSDVAQGKIDQTSEGVKKNYMDTSRQLTKQQENLQLTNVDAYRRSNQGIMQQESALQYDIDTMDQARKDMKAMYQVSDFFV